MTCNSHIDIVSSWTTSSSILEKDLRMHFKHRSIARFLTILLAVIAPKLLGAQTVSKAADNLRACISGYNSLCDITRLGEVELTRVDSDAVTTFGEPAISGSLG